MGGDPGLGGAWRLFVRLVLRPLWRHPLLTSLNVLSIALGVAVVASIQMANRSANDAFRATVRLVTGEADLEMRGRIPEEFLFLASKQPGVRSAIPTVEWIALAPDLPGGFVRVLGVDPFAGQEFRPFAVEGAEGDSLDLERWLRDPSALAVFPGWKQLSESESIRLETPRGPQDFQVAFRLQPREQGGEEDARLVAMDLAWAQEAGDLVGYLTSVQILLEEGADGEIVAEALRQLVPGDVVVQTPVGRTRQTEGLLASFQLNLTALSMVSLLVGCYLIYNTVAASVLRRRTEVGILRSLGAGPVLLRGMFLAEAAAAGLVGAVLGLFLAWPLAGVLTALVAQTISSLYVLLAVDRVVLTPPMVAGGLLLGVVAALAAAWIPSREAWRVDPREVLHPGHLAERVQPRVVPQLLGGLVLLGLAWLTGWGALQWHSGWLGFGSAFCVIAGFSLCVPWISRTLLSPVARSLAGISIAASLGAQNLLRSLHRNSITVAALAAAVAMLVSISVMIYSFRGSVTTWMDRTLVADLFVAPAANEVAGPQFFLDPELLRMVAEHPTVQEVATFREIPIVFGGEKTSLGVFRGEARGELDFVEGDSARRTELSTQPGHVAVSESFANRFGVGAGDSIELPLPKGSKPFVVAGTYRDYTRDAGTVLLTVENYLAAGGEDRPQSAGIFLQSGSPPDEVRELLEAWSEKTLPLSIYLNRELKTRVGEIFDQTFAITGVLRLIAIVVAVCGVLLSLGILVQERSREIAVLRALGASRGQVLRTVLSEAGLLGALASLVGMASGAGLALVLTYVINKAFFGWTVDLAYPWDFLAWTPVWVLATALLAALWPAWRATMIQPAEALRVE